MSLHRRHEKLVSLLPGKERNRYLAVFLLLYGRQDHTSGCRSPRIFTETFLLKASYKFSLTMNYHCAVFTALSITMTHNIGFRIALAFSYEYFSLL